MKQGSTYPIIIDVPGINLSGADWIIASLKPRMKPTMEYTKDTMTVTADDKGTALVITLTQAESLALNAGAISVGLNWMLDGVRGGARPRQIQITGTLLNRVVTA